MATDTPKPSILDRIIDLLEAKHYEAIGRFIVAYAAAEAFAHVALRHHCGLSDELGRAIFAGGRISEITEKFRAVARSKNDSNLLAEVEKLLTQFGVISTERGKIVHREGNYEINVGLVVSNYQTAKKDGESQVYSLRNLRDMTFDCKAIALRFRLISGPHPFDEEELQFLFEAWSYIPAQPSSKSHKSRGKT